MSLYRQQSGDVAVNQEQALSAFAGALAAYTVEQDRRKQGIAHNHLAGAFADLVSGDPAENLERAIEHGIAAVETVPPGSQEWAGYVTLLGQLYRDRRLGDPDENLSQAVTAFHAALGVWSRETHPDEWARTQNSLGVAYLVFSMRQNEPKVVQSAAAAFREALTVFTPDRHPHEWASAESNLASALIRSRLGDRSGNLELAIESFEASLTVFTLDGFPADWAGNQHNLAQAYIKRLAGDPERNLQKAAECLHAALATAIIAAAATVLTAVVTTLITGRQEKHQARSNYIQRQLNELYAPILLLLVQDNELQLQVKAGMPEGVHLLDRIDEIIADESRRPIVNQIIAVNKKIVEILEGKAGLSEGQAPSSFAHFIGHHYMLQRAFEGKPVVKDAPFRYFPAQFEKDVKDGDKSLRQKLDKELLPWYRRHRKKRNR
jgi:hypothetical protein